MVIIDSISEEVRVKLPNNLTKSSETVKSISLRNTETKKEYILEFEDVSVSGLWYVWTHTFSDLPVGEYEYEIEGNRGLLRIGQVMNKKVYDKEMTFKVYGE